MNIRKTELTDIDELQKLYEHARVFMAHHGNPTQWGSNYPPISLIEQDIRDGVSYVCEEDGQLLAAFFYKKGRDDTYAKIYDGQWLNDEAYGVVHRIASSGARKGCASFCLDWALKQCGNLKIDTHRDNRIMQHLLDKNGFTYCGVIYLDDGTERLAYQKSDF